MYTNVFTVYVSIFQQCSNSTDPYSTYPEGNHLAATLGFDRTSTINTTTPSTAPPGGITERYTQNNDTTVGSIDLPPAYEDHVNYPTVDTDIKDTRPSSLSQIHGGPSDGGGE